MTATITLPQTGTWALDPTHTSVTFTVRHLMAAKVRGGFSAVAGTIEIGDRPETSSAQVTIHAASFDSGVEDRDNHVRSGDFLDVESHPLITFNSTAVRPSGSGYELDGELTIRGVTKPVTLDMEYLGLVNDPWGNAKAIFSASTTINREDWGLTWNAPLETGGVLLGKDVKIEIEAQAAQV